MAAARSSGIDPLLSIHKELGELVADVRTIKHSQNNASMKLDAIGGLVERVEELVKSKDDHELRIKLLEGQDKREEGAKNLATWFMQSPVVAWLFALAVIAWTALKGQGK